MLVAVVADSSELTRRIALQNMQAVDAAYGLHGARLDWAVCAYDDKSDAWANALEASSRLERKQRMP